MSKEILVMTLFPEGTAQKFIDALARTLVPHETKSQIVSPAREDTSVDLKKAAKRAYRAAWYQKHKKQIAAARRKATR